MYSITQTCTQLSRPDMSNEPEALKRILFTEHTYPFQPNHPLPSPFDALGYHLCSIRTRKTLWVGKAIGKSKKWIPTWEHIGPIVAISLITAWFRAPRLIEYLWGMKSALIELFQKLREMIFSKTNLSNIRSKNLWKAERYYSWKQIWHFVNF